MAIASFLAKVPQPPTPGRPRVRRGGRRKMSPLDVAIDDAQRRSASGDWGEGTKGATLVGLYAFCHRLTYGIVPDELQEQRLFYAAAKRAAVLVHEQFEDNVANAVAFVVWSWEREKRRDSWARRNGADRNRLSWRLQFSASLVTDWRIEQRRRR